MTELLAPAGDKERLKIAFLYGADAVYFGGREFSLRANAKNFSNEEIKDATNYAHSINKKVYVTVNIVFHNDNLKGLEDYLKFLNEIKVDGIIVSDLLVVRKVRELKLDLFIVLSTQASVLNVGAVKFWQKEGIKRIVLAREADKENISKIIKETNIEIECFVHGAMCTSISGKCVLSNYLTNRDSNRGGCAQICRWPFKTEFDPLFQMTPKDLNMVDNIDDMIKRGIISYKVEGRMRSNYYIATVVLAYRRMIDLIKENNLKESDKKYYLSILNRCANRDSKSQFYDKFPDENDQYFNNNIEVTNQDFLGIVLNYDKENKIAKLEQRNYFKIGDEVQFFGPNMETFNYKINTIYDENMEEINIARHPKMIVNLKIEKELKPYDIMRIKSFDKQEFL